MLSRFNGSAPGEKRTSKEGRFTSAVLKSRAAKSVQLAGVNRPSLLVLILVILFAPTGTLAHDGPPFAIVVDQQVGPYKISVWGDPDVGDGTFFIIPNGPASEDLKFELGVQPTSGRLKEVMYSTEREDLRNQVQYKSVVKFDAQEMWRVRVLLQSSQGSGEATFTVEATPPGYGKWDLLIYFIPFLAIGVLWVVAIVRKRRKV